jgi:hypothetical protein
MHYVRARGAEDTPQPEPQARIEVAVNDDALDGTVQRGSAVNVFLDRVIRLHQNPQPRVQPSLAEPVQQD